MSQTAAKDQTIDYEHFIDYQLALAQGRIKAVDVGSAILHLLTGGIVYLLAVIALDHALVLSSSVRLWLLGLALAAGAGYMLVAVVVPSVRRINGFYAARTIEQKSPQFKNSLINFLDLRRRPEEVPSGVLAALENRAVTDLAKVRVEEQINQDRLMRSGYALAAAVVATCLAVLANELLLHRSLPQ